MTTSPALLLHRKLQGKISVKAKLSLHSLKNLSFAYTPGVAEVVNYIRKYPASLYDLTIKRNTIAVVSDGSAVLGLGNVGACAALPVMEGKCAIFWEFAKIQAFPLCLDTQDVDEIVETVKNVAPVFGGINLEDISAPRCFEIEERLQTLDIPVMHDDQHATAIVVLAALINAAKVVGKNLQKCKIVINGAGAAGMAIAKILLGVGVWNLVLVDSKGILQRERKGMQEYKNQIAISTNPENLRGSLTDAVDDADILIGVSVKGAFTKDIIARLGKESIVFALANPDPEILPEDSKRWGAQIIATGRSDLPNQVNNALVFPGFFKGLLEKRIRKITSPMKINAAYALASLVKHPTKTRIIPSILNRSVVPAIVGSLA